jgi:hypothetical protein
MIFKTMQYASSVLLCITLFAAGAQAQQADSSQAQTSTQSSQAMPSYTAPTVAPMTADQLDALVAPIALYPDALVAQVLGAAAAPDQVSAAALWLAQNNSLTGTALAQAVDQQTWDPSIKALTQFPDVLNNLAGNLGWTSELGQAFQNQQSDVMAAVQVMRAKAQAAGTLQSTPQIKVVQQSPQTIVIQPADPAVVYVPQYNPTVVYGTPYVVPLYTPPVVVAGPVVSYGPAIRIGVALAAAALSAVVSPGAGTRGTATGAAAVVAAAAVLSISTTPTFTTPLTSTITRHTTAITPGGPVPTDQGHMDRTPTARTDFSLTVEDIDRTAVTSLTVEATDQTAMATALTAVGTGRMAGAMARTTDPTAIGMCLVMCRTEAAMATTV